MIRTTFIVALYSAPLPEGDLDENGWHPVVTAATISPERAAEFYRLVDGWTTSQVIEFRRCGKNFYENSSIRFVVVNADDEESACKIALTKI